MASHLGREGPELEGGRPMRRLTVLFTATFLMTVLVAFPASADHSVEITVDGTATLNEFNTILTLTGEYTCTEPAGGINADNSGGGGQVYQSQKGGKVIVTEGLGIDGDLICDGSPQEWTADIQAHVDGVPAVWKRGKVLASVNIQVCSTDCHDGSWDQDVRSVKITK
jgi:hypothetical protein